MINLSEFRSGENGLWIDPSKAILIHTFKNTKVRFMFSTMDISIVFKKHENRADELVESILSGNTNIDDFRDSIGKVKVQSFIAIGVNSP